ncbi:MAG: hypothetical protein R3C59_05535 [Planctomycetaceae bacterium]
MQNPSSPFRLLMKTWLLLSVASVIWQLIPVFAAYHADQQKLADLERQRRQPPMAIVEVAEDSPWPDSTIEMRGRSIEGLDDSNLPSAGIAFGQRSRMLVAGRTVNLIDTASAAVVQSFPNRQDGERLYAGAISGDGKVVATVGEFTQVCFWNAATGTLLQTVEDDFPTEAAQPDTNAHIRRHRNGLRYSHAGSRRIVAAPGGCLFAIGKIDGSVELWTAEGRPLPDRPHGLVTADWPYRPDDPSPPPNRFRRLHRIPRHVGEVLDLEFTLDCRSLISTSGRRFAQMQEVAVGDSVRSHFSRPIYDNDTTPTVAKTEVASGDLLWQTELLSLPSALALDVGSQNVKGLSIPPRLVVAMDNQEVAVIALDDGATLKTFSIAVGKSRIFTTTMAFGDGSSLLWTTGTRYRHDSEQRTFTSTTAWDVIRGRRIATADVPGSIMSATWNSYGKQLATVRHLENTPSSAKQLPWSFHLWDVKIVSRKDQSTSRTAAVAP